MPPKMHMQLHSIDLWTGTVDVIIMAEYAVDKMYYNGSHPLEAFVRKCNSELAMRAWSGLATCLAMHARG